MAFLYHNKQDVGLFPFKSSTYSNYHSFLLLNKEQAKKIAIFNVPTMAMNRNVAPRKPGFNHIK
jgi:hypothetical protein